MSKEDNPVQAEDMDIAVGLIWQMAAEIEAKMGKDVLAKKMVEDSRNFCQRMQKKYTWL